MKRHEFLELVKCYIETDPEAAAYVSDHVQLGLSAALTEARERAADMEIALATLASKKTKNSDHFVNEVLGRWKGKTSLKWDWLEDELK